MNFPALIFWLVIVCSFWARPGTVLVLLLASVPFASLSLLPPRNHGWDDTLASDDVCRCFDPKSGCASRDDAVSKVLQRLTIAEPGYLALFLLWGVVATLIMPRLFQDRSSYSRCDIRG